MEYQKVFEEATGYYSQGLEQLERGKFTDAFDLFEKAMGVLGAARDEYVGIDKDKDRYDQLYQINQKNPDKMSEFFKKNDLASKIMHAMGLAVLNFRKEDHKKYDYSYELTTNEEFANSEDFLPKNSNFAEPYYYSAYLLFFNNYKYKKIAEDFPENEKAQGVAKLMEGVDWNMAAEEELVKGLQRNKELAGMHERLYAKIPAWYKNPGYEQEFKKIVNRAVKKVNLQ